MNLIDGEGKESTNLLGTLNLPWQGFGKKSFTKIEAHVGMAERLLGDLAIEEAPQAKIKRNTRTQKLVICRLVCSIRQVKNKNKVKLIVTYDMG